MLQAERQSHILDWVTRNGKITIVDICRLFKVSEMTARRDLAALDREGLLRRVHGGAIKSQGRSYEPPYQLRSTSNVDAKCAIGRKAAELVRAGDSLALDVGTTTLYLARALRHKANLSILTNSLPIANEIATSFSLSADVRLILAGGIVRSGELSMIGDIAEQTYRQFHVDKAFLGIGGISLEAGLTEYNLEDALVKRVLLSNAQQRILVADGSKFGRTTFAAVGPLSLIDTIVTDSSAPADLIDRLRQQGIEVLLADCPPAARESVEETRYA